MSKYFYRPSSLGNTNRFIASKVLGTVEPASKYMKRGTAAEEIAILGLDVVKKRWHVIPSTLPLDAAGKRIYSTWDKWSLATGINRDDDNCIDEDSWNQAIAAAKAIRNGLATLGEFRWQVKGSVELDVPVPIGYDKGIEGTTDIVTATAVGDIKVISRTDESTEDERIGSTALREAYGYQVSSYALIHNKNAGFILAAFPVDKDCVMWDYTFIIVPLSDKRAIEARCAELFESVTRLANNITSPQNINAPFSPAFNPVQVS